MSALDKWEQSHNIDEFTDFQIVEMLDAAAAENDELRLALKVSIVCNAEQKSWGAESPFQKILDGLVGKFEHEKVNRDDIAEGYCSYCETPLADVAAAREHGKICEKHPLRAENEKGYLSQQENVKLRRIIDDDRMIIENLDAQIEGLLQRRQEVMKTLNDSCVDAVNKMVADGITRHVQFISPEDSITFGLKEGGRIPRVIIEWVDVSEANPENFRQQ